MTEEKPPLKRCGHCKELIQYGESYFSFYIDHEPQFIETSGYLKGKQWIQNYESGFIHTTHLVVDKLQP